MKKVLIVLVAVFMMVGCGDLDLGGEVKSTLGIVDGLSAYEIAVDNGYVGTEAEWLDSLRGDAGVQGIAGLDGLSAYQLWILAGNEGTELDFIASLQGVDGIDGVCPVCDTNIPVPVIPDNTVAMVFKSKLAGVTNIKIGHLRDGTLIMIEDANITDDGNGTYTVVADVEVLEAGNHSIGITFDKGD